MVIGITGNIGSGKTEVSRIFQNYGFILIDVDAMGHILLEREEIKKKIKETFGDCPFARDKIDRTILGKIVFTNNENLCKFNSIVHPSLVSELRDIIKNRGKKSNLLVHCALIFKWKIEKLFDNKVLVRCGEQKIIERMSKTGKDKDYVRRILSLQQSDEDEVKKADFILKNNGDLLKLEKKTINIISSLPFYETGK